MIVPGEAITPDLLSGDYRHGDALTGKRRLQRVDMPGTSTALATFSYDLAGRMTRVGLGGATDTTMVFDAFDRMREVDAPGHGLIRHRYDASGERATTLSPGPAGGLVERFFGGGLTQRDGRLELHVGLGGARVVARLNVPAVVDGTPSLSDNLGGAPVIVYLHQGVGHGPTVMTDGAGALLEERHHEPYGTPLWVDADYELERLGWNGKPVDPLTGWSDHGARWHGTRFARWLSVDPPLKGPGGLVEHGLAATPYGFVAGNPVLFWDPDGMEPSWQGQIRRQFIPNYPLPPPKPKDIIEQRLDWAAVYLDAAESADLNGDEDSATELRERGEIQLFLASRILERELVASGDWLACDKCSLGGADGSAEQRVTRQAPEGSIELPDGTVLEPGFEEAGLGSLAKVFRAGVSAMRRTQLTGFVTRGVAFNRRVGKLAEKLIQRTFGGAKQSLKVPGKGMRHADNVTPGGVLQEDKVGRVGMRSGIQKQIEKDFWLVQNNQALAAEWHFFRGKTGVGPTQELESFLIKHNIRIVIHK